jgi:hypothetical protein
MNGKYLEVAAIVFVFFMLYFTSLSNYLFFHSLVEIFSIVIGVGIFVVLWTARRMIKNKYLRFIGIAYLFISSIDLVHTLGYKEMGGFFRDLEAIYRPRYGLAPGLFKLYLF